MLCLILFAVFDSVWNHAQTHHVASERACQGPYPPSGVRATLPLEAKTRHVTETRLQTWVLHSIALRLSESKWFLSGLFKGLRISDETCFLPMYCRCVDVDLPVTSKVRMTRLIVRKIRYGRHVVQGLHAWFDHIRVPDTCWLLILLVQFRQCIRHCVQLKSMSLLTVLHPHCAHATRHLRYLTQSVNVNQIAPWHPLAGACSWSPITSQLAIGSLHHVTLCLGHLARNMSAMCLVCLLCFTCFIASACLWSVAIVHGLHCHWLLRLFGTLLCEVIWIVCCLIMQICGDCTVNRMHLKCYSLGVCEFMSLSIIMTAESTSRATSVWLCAHFVAWLHDVYFLLGSRSMNYEVAPRVSPRRNSHREYFIVMHLPFAPTFKV